MAERHSPLARYSRQMLFERIGERGQRALSLSRVTLIGCGALGTAIAATLVRGGVGYLRIVDRDFVELDNLQRQTLFEESDVTANLPKAEAAARRLHKINSTVEVDGVVADASEANIESLCADADLLLDGTDNLETRYLLNDVAVKSGVPWIYGACVAAEGVVMTILPGRTACLRCVWDEPPPAGATATCDTVGVIGPVVSLVAAFQCVEALKLLTGKTDDIAPGLLTIDAWTGATRRIELGAARSEECVCCGRRRFEFLDGSRASASTTLCGRNAVQVRPAAGAGAVDFKAIASRLSALRPTSNEFILRFRTDDFEVSLFRDGRAIIKGTADPAVARGVYARYVGT